jgi:hypothetical protein
LQGSLLFFFKEKLAAHLLSLLCFLAALFTYELAWTFPLLLTGIVAFERLLRKKATGGKIIYAYWLILIAYLLYRFAWLRYPLPYGNDAGLGGNVLGLVRNFSALMARLFVPPVQSSFLFLALALLVAATVVFLLYRIGRANKQQLSGLLLLGLCSIIALLPVISLGIDTHDSESERFIYFASVFACLFSAMLFASVIARNLQFYLLMAAIIVINLFGLYRSSLSYRYASDVSRKLVQTLNRFSEVRTVNFVNLPTQYKGALLFRIGFVVNKPGILRTKYDAIKVVSYQELKSPVPFVVTGSYEKGGKKALTVEFAPGKILFY